MLRWWESITGNLVLSTELKMQIGYNVQSLKADVLSVSPLSERLEEWWVVCRFMQIMELHYWWESGGNMVTRKQD